MLPVAQRRAGRWGGGVELLHMLERTLQALTLGRPGVMNPGFTLSLFLAPS